MKKRPNPETASLRRKQIIGAAVAVITERGLQYCSLSEIEKRAGMCRGQLMYYFPTKEAILLAVFDHLVHLLEERAHSEMHTACSAALAPGRERLQSVLTFLLLAPPAAPEFDSLQYTFLSQIGHREDFRQRLADLYEEWRGGIARILEFAAGHRPGGVSLRTLAALVQAILQGLAVQRDADPVSYDPQEMLQLCLELLGSYLRLPAPDTGSGRRLRKKRVSVNGSGARGAARRPSRTSRV
jgi:AcrR family transcriptional regulator